MALNDLAHLLMVDVGLARMVPHLQQVPECEGQEDVAFRPAEKEK